MNLTEDQLEEFDEAFNFFDSDRDGLINEKTLGKMFKFTLLNDRVNTAVVLNFYLRVVPNHLSFEINVGKRRIRHTTTLNFNDQSGLSLNKMKKY